MKVCLAGTSVLKNKKEVINKSKYILESFYTIEEWQIPILKKANLFLLDSGAFTFMNSIKKGTSLSVKDFDNYLDKYIDFINKYDIKYFFELDIDVVVGYDKVKEMRKKLEAKTHKQCIPVWHKSRGLEEWKKLTKEYNYIAIGGFAIKDIKKEEYKYIPLLLKIAKDNNCVVHGLGFTYTSELKKYKFFSVDSTSWNGITRFNNYSKYNNHKHTIEYISKINKKLKKEERDNALVYSFNEWLKFQEYADKYL